MELSRRLTRSPNGASRADRPGPPSPATAAAATAGKKDEAAGVLRPAFYLHCLLESAAATGPMPPSLVDPDLRGLFSSATLKRDQLVTDGPRGARLRSIATNVGQRCYGGFVLLCLCGSWCAGAALPFVTVFLFSRDDPVARRVATGFLVVLIAPYTMLFKNLTEPWRAASRFWLSASLWFEGGATLA